MVIYTWGYGGRALADLRSVRDSLKAVIVDTRLSPFSRDPQWMRPALEAEFGTDFVWCSEFGNVNYKFPNRPTKLKAPTQGLARLHGLVSEARPPLLICMCRKIEDCHRLDVATFLAAQLGAEIVHLSGAAVKPRIAQMSFLF